MRKTAAVLVLAALVMIPATYLASECDGLSDEDAFLLDYGNGTYLWMDIVPGSTLIASARASLTAAGIAYADDGTKFTEIGGVGTETVGTQDCGWKFYVWEGTEWRDGTASGVAAYAGGSLAVGHYPDVWTAPAASPLHGDVWISSRNGSSFSGTGTGYGPSAAAPVVEWANTYTTGYSDSTIVAADGFVYHTTGGRYGATGAESNPYLYCLDGINGSIVWKVMYPKGAGYEISTPLIVGKLIFVSATNGHLYAFDRTDGSCTAELMPEGDTPHFLHASQTSTYTLAPTKDAQGKWLLRGQSLITGPSSCAYDAGALYFCTYDGCIRAYSVSNSYVRTEGGGFRELWTYTPDDSVRGCFYSIRPPVIAENGGSKVVLAGSYSGHMYCVDASSGTEIWTKQLIDNTSATNTNPGSVGSIVPDGKGGAIVVCTDGGMTAKMGYTVRVNVSNGDVLWKLDVLSNPAVVADSVFFVYLSPSSAGNRILHDGSGNEVSAVSGYYALYVDTGRIAWKTESSASVSAGMTYTDGRLYSADYSAGTFWPLGGGVSCLDPTTGNMLWRVKLEPSSGNSFCMTQPVVVDGRVFVGTDYSAVCCISDGRDLLLVDYGNGGTEWFRLERGSTVSNSVNLTLMDNGINAEFDDSLAELISVRETPSSAEDGHWTFFLWENGVWKKISAKDIYEGGHVAVGAYSGQLPEKDPTKDYGVTPEVRYESPGLSDRSWIALFAVTAVFLFLMIRIYRRIGAVD